MSLTLSHRDDATDVLRRRVLAHTGAAMKSLRSGPASRARRAAAVHDARRSLKKARAVLHLLRHAAGDEHARDLKACDRMLRDAGRSLGPARDAYVLRATLRSFINANRPPRSTRAALEKALRAGLRPLASPVSRGERAGGRDAPPHAATIGTLDGDIADALARVPVGRKRSTWRTVADGLRVSYRAARNAFGLASQSGTSGPLRNRMRSRMHEWRKLAKRLRYQIELLQGDDAPRLVRLGERLHKLTDALGEYHDLSMLWSCVCPTMTKDHRKRVEAQITERLRNLARNAARLGRREFGASPKHFTGRVRDAWRR